jgi:15-cis-phytoene desaturase
LEDYAARPEELDRISILDYAHRHQVHPVVIEHLLKPLTSGIFFIPVERYSAYAFFGLVAPYLPNLSKLGIGAFRGGMTEVMAAPIADAITRKGGIVRTGVAVRELWFTEGRVRGVITEDGALSARHVVLATSVNAAQRFVRRHWQDDAWAKPMLTLRTMPAATMQIELDEPCMNVDHTTFGVGTSLACFSEQSRTTFRDLRGRLSIILAPAEKFIRMPPDQVMETVLADADKLGLRVRNHVRRYRMVNHPDDFYALEPGQDALRPDQATPVPGLTLAGDYTRQVFLATMEGAVVSGHRAAAHASASLSGEA